jgi:hypothetical protein
MTESANGKKLLAAVVKSGIKHSSPLFSVYPLDLLELRSLPYAAVSYMNLDFE